MADLQTFGNDAPEAAPVVAAPAAEAATAAPSAAAPAAAPEAAPPDAPNTNRPKQPGLTKPAAGEAGPVSAADAAASKAAFDEAVQKQVETIIASMLPSLVETQVAAANIDARIDNAVSSRVSGAEIDAMVVASVSAATRDLVKPVDSPRAGNAPADTEVSIQKQAEMEQRVWQRLQAELQNTLRSQSNAPGNTSPSRPLTGPRPFSSEAQSSFGPQDKAAWTSSTLYAVANVPNHDASRSALSHSDLERDLTEKVLANQPDRSALGFSEIIMRDIANSVVKELVGIFESLLDRLLMEKKQTTLCTLVAELVTEDTLKVMAKSAEQMKQMELGHITRELERLGLEAREREQAWNERFLITQELRDSQDDLYATLDERCRGIEARLLMTEQNKCERTELDARFEQKLNEGEAFRRDVYKFGEQIETVSNELAEQKRQSTHNFVSRNELERSMEQLNNDISSNKNAITSGFKELREYAAPNVDLQGTRTELDERLVTLDKKLSESIQNITSVDSELKKTRQYSDATFCTKVTLNDTCLKMEDTATETNTKVFKMLDDHAAIKATKREVEEVRTSIRTSLSDLNQTVAKNSSSLDRTTGSVVALEQRVEQSFATRVYVDESQKKTIEEVVLRSDTREELGRLWKDFDAERERLRQSVRQQQSARKDLNDAIEGIQSLRNGAVETVKHCEVLDTSFTEVDTRETAHWEQGQESLRQQRQAYDDLEVFYKALRDEFMAHQEFQKGESEKLRSHSTICYMEQIEKALNLTESVQKVERSNRELGDSMKSIKLPTL